MAIAETEFLPAISYGMNHDLYFTDKARAHNVPRPWD